MQFVGIIKEQDCTEQGALAHSLCADEVYIAIQLHFGITYIGTVDENDFP